MKKFISVLMAILMTASVFVFTVNAGETREVSFYSETVPSWINSDYTLEDVFTKTFEKNGTVYIDGDEDNDCPCFIANYENDGLNSKVCCPCCKEYGIDIWDATSYNYELGENETLWFGYCTDCKTTYYLGNMDLNTALNNALTTDLTKYLTDWGCIDIRDFYINQTRYAWKSGEVTFCNNGYWMPFVSVTGYNSNGDRLLPDVLVEDTYFINVHNDNCECEEFPILDLKYEDGIYFIENSDGDRFIIDVPEIEIPAWMSTEYTLEDVLFDTIETTTRYDSTNAYELVSEDSQICPCCNNTEDDHYFYISKNDTNDYFGYCDSCNRAFYLGRYFDDEIVELVKEKEYEVLFNALNEYGIEIALEDLFVGSCFEDMIGVMIEKDFAGENKAFDYAIFWLGFAVSTKEWDYDEDGLFYFDNESTFANTGSNTDLGINCAQGYMSTSTGTVQLNVYDHNYKLAYTTASCTRGGMEGWLCSVCGKMEQRLVGAYEHNIDEDTYVEVKATCTEDGYVEFDCKDCGKHYLFTTEYATGHNYKAVVTPATCTTDGYTTYTCENCGDTYKADETPATGHNWKYVSDLFGQDIVECTICHNSKMVSHNWVEIERIEPTCAKKGMVTYYCDICGQCHEEYLDKLEHDTVTCTTESTCTEHGHIVTVCKDCGEIISDEELELLSHRYTHVIVDATYDSEGEEYDVCSECGEITNYKTIAKLVREDDDSGNTITTKCPFILWLKKIINTIYDFFTGLVK